MTRLATALCLAALTAWPSHTQGAPPPAPAATAPTVAPSVPAGSVLLRYKFNAGDQHTYKLVVDERGTVTLGQQQVPLNQQLQMSYRQSVQSVDPSTGNATISMQFQSFTLIRNGQTLPMSESTIAALKKPITGIMSPTGTLTSMDFSGLAAAMPGGSSPLSLMRSPAVLPDNPVKPGDSWQQALAAPNQGTKAMMLAAVDHQNGDTVARINQNYNLNLNLSGQQTGAGGQTGTMTGTAVELFDTDLGLPTNTVLNAQLDLHAAAPVAAGAQQAPTRVVINLHMVMSLADGAPN